MLIIQASNIHTGGGAILLSAALRACVENGVSTTVFHDSRFQWRHKSPHIKMIPVQPSLIDRLKAEWQLRQLATESDTTLCFGNLPPFFRLKGKCILFFQNILLLQAVRMDFPFRVVVKQILEKLWLSMFFSNVNRVIVQSSTVQDMMLSVFPNSKPEILPFAEFAKPTSAEKKIYDFLYVSSGDPHKNHIKLLAAWERLANAEMFPSLMLTVSDAYPELLSTISILQKNGLNILNEKKISHRQVMDLYQQSRCLIFPSLAESFGLPLFEAKNAGLPILASELDYVRDVVEPLETFDPNSSRSIERAILRFLKTDEAKPQNIYSSQEFIQSILGK